MPAFNPNMWKNGLTMRYRSSVLRPVIATQSLATHRVRPWVMTTPLGTPVVPEVNRMSDGSEGPSSEHRWSTCTRSGRVARAMKPVQDTAPSGTGPLATTTVASSGSSTPVARSMAT